MTGFLVAAVLAVAAQEPRAGGFVHREHRQLVDGAGKPLLLRGVNLGGWLVWEGWILGKGFVSDSTIRAKLADRVGAADVEAFAHALDDAFISDDDFTKIAELGFNSVRIPFSFDGHSDAFAALDRALDSCEKHKLMAVLDLHAASQSGVFTADPHGAPLFGVAASSAEKRAFVVAQWTKLAAHVRERRSVAGYDLLNEPSAKNAELLAVDRAIIAGIRSVDDRHLVIVEGNDLARDFAAFKGLDDPNEAYSFHIYTWFGDDRKKRLDEVAALSERDDAPIIAGEFGENKEAMVESTRRMFEERGFGFFFWTWKRAPSRFPGLAVVDVPPSWQRVMDWVAGGLFQRTPSADEVKTGMRELLDAVRVDRAHIDVSIAQALLPTVASPRQPKDAR